MQALWWYAKESVLFRASLECLTGKAMCTEVSEIDFKVFHSLSKLCNKWDTPNWTQRRNMSLPLISVSLTADTAPLDLLDLAFSFSFEHLNITMKNNLALFSKWFALFIVGILNAITNCVPVCLLSRYIWATIIFSGFPAET